MSNFTFLTEEQYLGSDKLEILEKRGTKAAITDFSILLGAYVLTTYILKMIILWREEQDIIGQSHITDVMTRAWLPLLVVAITTLLTDAMVGLAQLYRSHQSLVSPRTESVGKEQEMVSLK